MVGSQGSAEWRQTHDDEHDVNRATETSPLLGQSTSQPSAPVTSSPATWRSFLQHHTVTLCVIMILCLETGGYVQLAPVNKILEGIICRDFYPEMAGANPLAVSEDPRCKDTAVESKLAMLRGWQATLECIPGIITGVPYGLLSDKYGRKVVMILSLTGIILGIMWFAAVCWWSNVFPVWVTLTAPAFSFIGGGTQIFVASLYTVVADVVPDDERATNFFRLGAGVLVGELISNSVSGALTDKHPWSAIFLGMGLLFVGLFIACIIPETLHLAEAKKNHPDIATTTEGEDSQTGRNEQAPSGDEEKAWHHFISSTFVKLKAATQFVTGHRHIPLLLLTCIVSVFGRYIQELVLQYVTKRLNWTWSQAAYLMTVRSAANLLNLVVILPFISNYLITHLLMTTKLKDLWLVRMSSVLLVSGSYAIGLSGHPIPLTIGLVIYAMGGGFGFLVRSLITSMVEPHYVATLYNIIAICEAAGIMSAGPALSASFRRGLQLGGAWIGLPFFISGTLFAICATVVWSLRVKDVNEDNNDEESLDGEQDI
ncbi:major facilitator superfamily domain-containing protein [Xylogone sp. PMI_703]|nr:major facilitator superfamily domain-containing protein [Xylogone sp. PMI_703]